MNDQLPQLERLIHEVRKNSKYAQLAENLVARIASEELVHQSNLQKAVKSTRTRLHRLTGAYLPNKLDYAQWLLNFKNLTDHSEQELKLLSRQMMRLHASTAERLPVIDHFYQTCLDSIKPVNSILDLACGLNPLAIPFMPLSADCEYTACDVVLPLVDFLGEYFSILHPNGKAAICDLSSELPSKHTHLTLLMKTMPLLDQINKDLARQILQNLNSDHILISYPSKSLSGKLKGMRENYSERFDQLVDGLSFTVAVFTFPNESVFLLSR